MLDLGFQVLVMGVQSMHLLDLGFQVLVMGVQSVFKIRIAQIAMINRTTVVSELCKELGVSPMTLYRYISPKGELRPPAYKVLEK